MICFDQADIHSTKLHVIATDLQLAPFVPHEPSKRREKNWKPIFFSKEFVREHQDMILDTYCLGERRLKNLGIEVTKARAALEMLAAIEADRENKAQPPSQTSNEVEQRPMPEQSSKARMTKRDMSSLLEEVS